MRTEMAAFDEQELRRRRAGARRTVWLLALVSLLFYLGFVMTGVLGNG